LNIFKIFLFSNLKNKVTKKKRKKNKRKRKQKKNKKNKQKKEKQKGKEKTKKRKAAPNFFFRQRPHLTGPARTEEGANQVGQVRHFRL
jgi:hypothetical protein